MLGSDARRMVANVTQLTASLARLDDSLFIFVMVHISTNV